MKEKMENFLMSVDTLIEQSIDDLGPFNIMQGLEGMKYKLLALLLDQRMYSDDGGFTTSNTNRTIH